MDKKFSIKQRVQTWDDEDSKMVEGTVKEVDKNFIKVKWDDRPYLCEHYKNEINSIFIL